MALEKNITSTLYLFIDYDQCVFYKEIPKILIESENFDEFLEKLSQAHQKLIEFIKKIKKEYPNHKIILFSGSYRQDLRKENFNNHHNHSLPSVVLLPILAEILGVEFNPWLMADEETYQYRITQDKMTRGNTAQISIMEHILDLYLTCIDTNCTETGNPANIQKSQLFEKAKKFISFFIEKKEGWEKFQGHFNNIEIKFRKSESEIEPTFLKTNLELKTTQKSPIFIKFIQSHKVGNNDRIFFIDDKEEVLKEAQQNLIKRCPRIPFYIYHYEMGGDINEIRAYEPDSLVHQLQKLAFYQMVFSHQHALAISEEKIIEIKKEFIRSIDTLSMTNTILDRPGKITLPNILKTAFQENPVLISEIEALGGPTFIKNCLYNSNDNEKRAFSQLTILFYPRPCQGINPKDINDAIKKMEGKHPFLLEKASDEFPKVFQNLLEKHGISGNFKEYHQKIIKKIQTIKNIISKPAEDQRLKEPSGNVPKTKPKNQYDFSKLFNSFSQFFTGEIPPLTDRWAQVEQSPFLLCQHKFRSELLEEAKAIKNSCQTFTFFSKKGLSSEIDNLMKLMGGLSLSEPQSQEASISPLRGS